MKFELLLVIGPMSSFKQFRIYTILGWLHSDLTNCCIVVLENKIFSKHFPVCFYVKLLTPSWGPRINSGVVIKNLH